MADIVHRVGIKAPAARVYEALSTIKGLSGWWTDNVAGNEAVGGEIRFQFFSKANELIGAMLMRVSKLVPGTSVSWRCVEGPPEWIGTDIGFDLEEKDGMTIVLFHHRGWAEIVEFTHHCSTKWAVFLLSLRELVEMGKGKPSPDDLKIDNWN